MPRRGTSNHKTDSRLNTPFGAGNLILCVPRALPSATQKSPFRRQLDRLAKGSARGSRAALGGSPKALFLISSFAELQQFRRAAGIRTRAACAPQTNLLDWITVEHPLRGWKLDAVCSEGVALGYVEVVFQATITALTRAKCGRIVLATGPGGYPFGACGLAKR